MAQLESRRDISGRWQSNHLFEICSAFSHLTKSCAIISAMEQQELIEKIKRLPQDSVAEVEDFVDYLARSEGILSRKSRHQALTNYAIQHAGTDPDLDSDLEAAATDHLLQQNSEQ